MATISERILEIIDKKNISRTEFAAKLNITQAYVSKIINKGSIPSDRLIEDIVEKFDISEDWLRYGTGEMLITRTRSQIITDFAADLILEEDESFKKRLIEALAQLDVDEWKVLEGIAEKLSKKS